jgi:hypothetical protein
MSRKLPYAKSMQQGNQFIRNRAEFFFLPLKANQQMLDGVTTACLMHRRTIIACIEESIWNIHLGPSCASV